MAWTWSHTNEAYAAAERNLRRLDRETLLDIAAEWQAHDPGSDDADSEGFIIDRYTAARATLAHGNVPDDVLADMIWDCAEDAATCDNGGWNAWLCPYGCGPHCVPFDDDQSEE